MPKFDVGLLNYPNRTIRFAHELIQLVGHMSSNRLAWGTVVDTGMLKT